MIPQAAITHWRTYAPWPQDAQVEQDLILTRALIEIFVDSSLSAGLLLRGGTALNKLYVRSPNRYSEDIDLVQAVAGPIGPIMSGIRKRLDPLLGKPRRENNPDNVTLRYRIESEIPPVIPIRLKIEINTREHFVVHGAAEKRIDVTSPWFSGGSTIRTYSIEELLGTKMRALYQRRKGRDLFDLWLGLTQLGADPNGIVEAFRSYIAAQGVRISRSEFERNLAQKLDSTRFNDDLFPLLAPGVRYDASEAADLVNRRLLSQI